jgi:7-cyano-7-deazaguanine synthase
LNDFTALVDALQPGLEIATPLAALDKAAVIRLGIELGVDLADTWSCLLGHERQCGACPQCRNRRAAFRAAGVDDPTPYRHAPAGT